MLGFLYGIWKVFVGFCTVLGMSLVFGFSMVFIEDVIEAKWKNAHSI